MNLYEFNKKIYQNAPNLDLKNEDFNKVKFLLDDFYNSSKSKYYMLLCKDLSYYTVFIEDDKINRDFSLEVIETLLSLGKIKDLAKTKENVLEIWFENNSEIFCAYMFDYKNGVVLFG